MADPLVSKLCQRCSAEPAVSHERFCKACRKVVVQELKDAGYLRQAPQIGFNNRGSEKREEGGRDGNPWQENAVRSLEDASPGDA